MLRSIAWLGCVAAALAQFDFKHSQYETSPPVYPSPNITGAGGWEGALVKARAFVTQLTLEEKAGMVTGTGLHVAPEDTNADSFYPTNFESSQIYILF